MVVMVTVLTVVMVVMVTTNISVSLSGTQRTTQSQVCQSVPPRLMVQALTVVHLLLISVEQVGHHPTDLLALTARQHVQLGVRPLLSVLYT